MTFSFPQQRTRMLAGCQGCLPVAYPAPIARDVWRSTIDELLNDFKWLPGLDSNQRPFD
jgi:hypothetical protein